jgi:hypothetical protein
LRRIRAAWSLAAAIKASSPTQKRHAGNAKALLALFGTFARSKLGTFARSKLKFTLTERFGQLKIIPAIIGAIPYPMVFRSMIFPEKLN